MRNGIDNIEKLCSIPKIDVLSGLGKLKICTAYEIDGKIHEYVPADTKSLDRAIPIYEELDGWDEDIVAALQFLLAVHAGDETKHLDDIDHFGNRRVRTVGELVQNQFFSDY